MKKIKTCRNSDILVLLMAVGIILVLLAYRIFSFLCDAGTFVWWMVPLGLLMAVMAAGGFGAGCAALLCGALRSGITTVLDTVDFDRRAVGCDLVVTGEGSFDAQSLGGKAISGVAGRCQKLHVPAAVLAGRVALTPEQWAPLDLRAVRSINPTGATLEDARANAAAYYRTALEMLLKEWK